ncbi:MAG: hypothetical protein AAB722_02305 [Patescibacteria group bacterium]
MINRYELLEKKAQEILKEVSGWAKEELCLTPEEHLTVVLKIEKEVLSVKAPRESVLDIPLLDFFSPQRCLDILGDKTLFTRVRDRLTDRSRFWESINHDQNISLKTVGELVIFGRRRLLDTEYIGRGVVKKIDRMLATVDLKLDE